MRQCLHLYVCTILISVKQLYCFICNFVPHMDNARLRLELGLCPCLGYIQEVINICIPEMLCKSFQQGGTNVYLVDGGGSSLQCMLPSQLTERC